MRRPVTPPDGTKPDKSASHTEAVVRCASFSDLSSVKAYLDGELSAPRRWQMRRHLAACAECREEAGSLQHLGGIMKEMDKAIPRPELRARILASLPDTPDNARPAEQKRTQNAPWLQRAPRYAFSGLAAMLGIGAFALGFSHRQTLRPAVSHTNDTGVTALAPAILPESGNSSDSPPGNGSGDGKLGTTGAPVIVVDAKEQRDNDLVNAETERLYLLRQKERLLDERRHPAIKTNQGSTVHGVPVRPGGAMLHPAEIALAVPDLAAARTSLQLLAQQSGGTVLPASATSGMIRKNSVKVQSDQKAVKASDNKPSSADDTGMLLRIPVSRLTAVCYALGKIGVLQPLPTTQTDKTGRSIPKNFQVYTTEEGGFRGDGKLPKGFDPYRPYAFDPAVPGQISGQKRVLMPAQIDADTAPEAYVLVYVRLQATSHTAH